MIRLWRLRSIFPAIIHSLSANCLITSSPSRFFWTTGSLPPYARDTATGQHPILAPGEASQVYNYAHTNQYIYDLSCIAAQGCRVGMYSGSQHRDGTLDHEEARRLGAAYHVLDKLSPWLTEREAYGNIGIIQSDASNN